MSDAEQREEAVFEAVLQLSADQRGAYLDQTCAGDADLRRRLDVLLGAFERAGGFMKQPASPERTVRLSFTPTEKPGDRIGRYKLLEQIGEGGCGVVYVAEQEEPVRRRVALKIIKLGMDTKQVIARFDAERQALAMMDHPNIAKIHDAGVTETGRPYFVMELVRGVKITDYCDQNHLASRERLDLFIQVCRAVQHAHQKGIIHRDIKPSNILVTLHDGVPVPKVIDFGIAKATQGRLTDQTVFTAFEQFIGTPAYMSPEQAELSGLDIDTRSDIYSLGVLLYQLLTGTTPFDAKELLAKGLDEMRRTIREVEPVKPSTRLTQELSRTQGGKGEKGKGRSEAVSHSTLNHQLSTDLDWIVMKSLEKDRTRRYETANGLATDIARHLSNEPIVARPPSRLYRFQKTVQRNKLAFAAAAAIVSAVIMGLGASTWEYLKEREARRRAVAAEQEQIRLREEADKARANETAQRLKAETEAARSTQVAQFMKDMLQGVGPGVALGRDTKLLREILDNTARRVNTEVTNQPEVRAELLFTVGEMYLKLGEFDRAAEALRESLRLRRLTFGETNKFVAASLHMLARIRVNRRGPNDYVEGEALVRQALAMRRMLLGEEHPEVADSLAILAAALQNQGRRAEAEPIHRQALATRRKLLHDHPDVASSLNNLALLLTDQGKLDEAERMLREAITLQRKLYGDEHYDVATSLRNLGNVLFKQGRLAEAEAAHRQALAMRRKFLPAEHSSVRDSINQLASVLDKEGKGAEAETLLREELAVQEKRLGVGHPDLADLLGALANTLATQGKLDEAIALFSEALPLQRKLRGNSHVQVAYTASSLAGLLWRQGKLAEAEALYRGALAIQRRRPPDQYVSVESLVGWIVELSRAQGKDTTADSLEREAAKGGNVEPQGKPDRPQ
jgi:serine/threonine protein kinase/Tfp pilus assembly protein PilF